MNRKELVAVASLLWLVLISPETLSFTPTYYAFGVIKSNSLRRKRSASSSAREVLSVDSVDEASRVLSKYDQLYNLEFSEAKKTDDEAKADLAELGPALAPAVRLLADVAAAERSRDSTKGRCMLGICASTAEEGVATLKAWVTALQLPRGLLHGMDKDGIPIDLSGSVYIKYNSGGGLYLRGHSKIGNGF